MRERIGVIDNKGDTSRALCAVLKRHDFQATPLSSLSDFESDIRKCAFQVLILDLDSLPVDNRFIRDLRKQNPEVPIIALSSRTFHPELQEALSLYISACLAKPVNPDELIYWLKSIFQDQLSTEGSVGEQKRINDLG